MVRVKCAFEGQSLRRFSIRDDTEQSPLTLSDLRTALAATYPTVDFTSQNFVLSFVDDEGDECGLEIDEDLREALTNTPNLLRLNVRSAPFVQMPRAENLDAEGDAAMETVVTSEAAVEAGKQKKSKLALSDFIEDYLSDAEGDEFPDAFAKIDRGTIIVSKDSGLRTALRSLRVLMRGFILKNCNLKGLKKNPTLIFPEGCIDSFIDGIVGVLQSAGVQQRGIASITEATRAAIADPGVVAAMTRVRLANRQKNLEQRRLRGVEDTSNQPLEHDRGVQTISDAPERETSMNESPLSLILKAVQSEDAKAALSKFHDECVKHSDDVEKMNIARKDMRKATMTFVKECIPASDAVVHEDAIKQYSEVIENILVAIGTCQDVARAAAEVAFHLAKDDAVRAQAFLIRSSGKKKSTSNMTSVEIGAEHVEMVQD